MRTIISILLCAFLAITACQSSPEQQIGSATRAYKHGPPPGPMPWSYYITVFGGGSDTQNTACGKIADGKWYYSTGVYHFGCGAKLKIEANGKCVVVEVADNGPAAWVEAKANSSCTIGKGLGVYNGYIIDTSPLVTKHLFGMTAVGWSDCKVVAVSAVAKATPAGPCTPSPKATCGNGKLEGNETCDPPWSCPTVCGDGKVCTKDVLVGAASKCTAACQYLPIAQCQGGDGCCPSGCSASTDADCSGSSVCGNGKIEGGETCDPPTSCPTQCNDANACTADFLSGSAATCNSQCQHVPVTACISGDGCCGSGCTAATDSDCGGGTAAVCGNGKLEFGETCDPPGSCPSTCDDGYKCSLDRLVGQPSKCTAKCEHTAITQCRASDGCCPSGCGHANDSDCSSSCGNGLLETNETCDPPNSCPANCDDGVACTEDVLVGAASSCSAQCLHNQIVGCAGGDGCCPTGCGPSTDTDCRRGAPTFDAGAGLYRPGGGGEPAAGGCRLTDPAASPSYLLLLLFLLARRRRRRAG